MKTIVSIKAESVKRKMKLLRLEDITQGVTTKSRSSRDIKAAVHHVQQEKQHVTFGLISIFIDQRDWPAFSDTILD